MAHIHPTYAVDPLSLPINAQYGIAREVETLQWLRCALPDVFTIFHSTHIAWMDNSRLKNREADFLVVNSAGQILMVEQKTGRLEELSAGLHKTYGAVTKNVVVQCNDVIDGLRERYRAANGREAKLDIQFLLYCPDHTIRNVAAAGIAPEQIVDARRARALPNVIRQFLQDRPADEAQFTRVRLMLAQALQFDIDQEISSREGEKLVTRLTDDLLGFLGGLDMTPYKLQVDGTAGCGKTQMVTWFAERGRSAGKRSLVVCFNRLLADSLRGALPAEVTVDTLHGLARHILENAGQPPDMSRANEAGFFNKLVASATDVALSGLPDDAMFGSCVIDEGQDISQDGFELVKLLLRPGASVVWLQDENQRLYGGRPFGEAGFVRYRCRDNYRTPRRIARFIKALLGTDFEIRNPLPGDVVQISDASGETLLGKLGERVRRLTEDGYLPEQIVILTGRGMQSSAIMQASEIGGHGVRRLAGHTSDGIALFTEGPLRVETLWRFKGQQAPAILVCELGGSITDVNTQRRVYVAATRATARLEFLLPKTSPLMSPLRAAAAKATDKG